MASNERDVIARINQESERLFGRQASDAKFAWRNAERARLGLGREKKTRGGVAGQWDRNKALIKPLAAGAAGLLTGGALAPTLLGAAMGGFDRPGRGGIGLDIGGALRGAGEGALAGGVGAGVRGAAGINQAASGMQGAKASLSKYFGLTGPASTPTPAPTVAPPVATPSLSGSTQGLLTGQVPSVNTALATTTPAPSGLRGLGASALQFAKSNPQAVAGITQGISGAIGAGAQRDATLMQMEFERKQFEEQQLARRRMAELLAPEWAAVAKRRGMPLATSNIDLRPTDFAALNPNRG